MRTLQEITDAVRRGEEANGEELRYAICAYDVLLHELKIAETTTMVGTFATAATMKPNEYIGWDNDYKNPEVVAWHKAAINVVKNVKPVPPDEYPCDGSGCTSMLSLPAGSELEEVELSGWTIADNDRQFCPKCANEPDFAG